MTHFLERLGRRAATHPLQTILAWLLVAAGVAIAALSLGRSFTDRMSVPGSSSERAEQLLRAELPEQTGASASIAARFPAAAADAQSRADELQHTVQAMSHVRDAHMRWSEDGRIMLLQVTFDEPVADLDAAVITAELDDAAAALTAAGATVGVGGELPQSIQGPDGVAESIGALIAMVLLLITFRSAIAAGLPLLLALAGIGLGMGLVVVLTAFADVSTISPTLGLMLGLGAGIDYGLLIVSRFRQELFAGAEPVVAVSRSMATAGHSVVVAGISVLIGITGIALCGIPSFATMGVAAGAMVLATLLTALTLLPALLGALGTRVLGRRTRARATEQRRAENTSARSRRWTEAVVRRPTRSLLGAVAALVLLALPALGMRLGYSDAGAERAGSSPRIAYDLVSEGFGPGANGPLLIVTDVRTGADPEALAARVAADPGVVSVSPVGWASSGDVAVFTAQPAFGPQEQATAALVERVHGMLPSGTELAGPTASLADLADRLGDRLWVVIGGVLAASVVLLLMMLRSVVLPVKAVLGNLLSVVASFGVLTLAFQTRAGAALIGLDAPVPIAAWAPMVLFAILFGLSMDYEIFLLAAVRERHLAGDDNRAAVVNGMNRARRIVVLAALIMMSVALGFAADPSVLVRLVGIGMTVAVAIDVLIVRMVLVPAALTLAGRWNWWWPGRRQIDRD